jgi:hypothetical protein
VSALAHLASLAGLWTAFQGTFGAAVTTRGGARGEGGGDPAYDVDLIPGAGINANEGRFNLSLGYNPLLNMRDVSGNNRASVVLHNGYLSLGYTERALSLSLSQSASVGKVAFRGLRAAPLDPKAVPDPTMPKVDLVPANEVVQVFNESTNASVGYRWDARLSSALGGSYSISGGSGQAQTTLPRIRTAGGTVSTNYLISGSDTIGGNVGLTNIGTHGGTFQDPTTMMSVASPDYDYWTVAATATWSHRFSRIDSVSFFGGAYGYNTTIVHRRPYYALTFTGGGSYDTELFHEGRLTVTSGLGVSVAPAINALSGEIQRRVQGTGRVGGRYEEWFLNITGDGSGSIPFGDPNAARIVGVGASLGYAPAKFMDISLEYRSTWQHAGSSPVSRLWVAFLNLSFRAPPVRF